MKTPTQKTVNKSNLEDLSSELYDELNYYGNSAREQAAEIYDVFVPETIELPKILLNLFSIDSQMDNEVLAWNKFEDFENTWEDFYSISRSVKKSQFTQIVTNEKKFETYKKNHRDINLTYDNLINSVFNLHAFFIFLNDEWYYEVKMLEEGYIPDHPRKAG